MEPRQLYHLFLENLPFEPTPGQQVLLKKLAIFIRQSGEHSAFVLRGFAGTGKTTIVSAVIKTLPAIRAKSVLLAPTGRAAKVLGAYSGAPASTIHRKIYRTATEGGNFLGFSLKENLHRNTLFIVDEASMIGNERGVTGKSLLDDLVEFVYSGVNCKLLFIGDTAQLPPVGIPVSPALEPKYLEKEFHLETGFASLTDVVRQASESGILFNATSIRTMLSEEKKTFPRLTVKGFKDVIRIDSTELEDALNSAFSRYGVEGTVVICRSNKRANIFNQQIRARIRWQEEEIGAGDYMMVVKNNYHWLPEKSSAGFIANGDIIEILRVKNIHEMHGFRFADARIRLTDYPDEQELEVKVLLNSVMSEAPSITGAESKALFESVQDDYLHIGDKGIRMQQLRKDPYLNALQVKFAYAVTCHKAQGGQWECAFVEQGFLTEEMIDTEFLRWLYTAVTRPFEKLYFVNFNEKFFEDPVLL